MKIVQTTRSRLARIWGCVIVAAALSACDAAPPDSAADDRSDETDSALTGGSRSNPVVVPPDRPVLGRSQARWSAIWWQQIYSIPYDRNPVVDTTGEDCEEGAHDGVWFLAGTTGGSVTRTCTIPTGKFIFFPLVNTADDNISCEPPLVDCTGRPLEDCLTEDAHRLLTPPPDTLFATWDGHPLVKPVEKLFGFDQTSRLFFFKGDLSLKEQFDSCITGRLQPAVAFGWWIMLAPPAPGDHTLKFGGTGRFQSVPPFDFDIDVTYDLHIGRPHHPPR
jgi:hypothetical protein